MEIWDFEFDEPYVAPNEDLSPETLALIAADTTPLNLDEPLALEKPPIWQEDNTPWYTRPDVNPWTDPYWR